MDYSKFSCSICNEKLQNYDGKTKCFFCETKYKADWKCENGHYICDECRIAEPVEIIKRVCKNTKLVNPYEIADKIMLHQSFNDHGIEHHYLVAPVILASLKNNKKIKNLNIINRIISSSIKKIKDIPYGVCGSRGDCGACVSAGAAMGTILKSSYKKAPERSKVLSTTAKCLQKLANYGGIRCCKQSVYASIETFFELYYKEYENFKLKTPICKFSDRIDICKKEKCPYYDK